MSRHAQCRETHQRGLCHTCHVQPTILLNIDHLALPHTVQLRGYKELGSEYSRHSLNPYLSKPITSHTPVENVIGRSPKSSLLFLFSILTITGYLSSYFVFLYLGFPRDGMTHRSYQVRQIASDATSALY
jgi:hypothetical protein